MKSEWIKTSEQLPEEGQEVLAATPEGVGHFVYKRCGWSGRLSFVAYAGFISGREWEPDGYEVDYVRYWMPLPELPEEEKEETNHS